MHRMSHVTDTEEYRKVGMLSYWQPAGQICYDLVSNKVIQITDQLVVRARGDTVL